MGRWRNQWVHAALEEDANDITRIFAVTASARTAAGSIRLFRRLLGWDDSAPPHWARPQRIGNVVVDVSQHGREVPNDVFGADDLKAIQAGTVEIRRVVPPVVDWLDSIASRAWDLSVPIVQYEIWASPQNHGGALEKWRALSAEERRATGLSEQFRGYLGSTLLLLPQMQPFLAGTHDLVVPGNHESVENGTLVSEVLDGPLVLSRAVRALTIEPMRKLVPEDARNYLRLHFAAPNFGSLNERLSTDRPDRLAPFPSDRHGRSGSDWSVTFLRESVVSTATVGLIRGQTITKEPWSNRVPDSGFSAPARVHHVPANDAAKEKLFTMLSQLAGPLSIADPFARPDQLERLRGALENGRILTSRLGKDGTSRFESVTEWARANRVVVRCYEDLHDRVVFNNRRALILGHSLSGVGKREWFMVNLDNHMGVVVTEAFENAWRASRDDS